MSKIITQFSVGHGQVKHVFDESTGQTVPVVATDADPGTFSAITPSDSVDLPSVTRGVYVGGDGNVVAVSEAGVAVTFANASAGAILPIRARRINATGTTATGLVALI